MLIAPSGSWLIHAISPSMVRRFEQASILSKLETESIVQNVTVARKHLLTLPQDACMHKYILQQVQVSFSIALTGKNWQNLLAQCAL